MHDKLSFWANEVRIFLREEFDKYFNMVTFTFGSRKG